MRRLRWLVLMTGVLGACASAGASAATIDRFPTGAGDHGPIDIVAAAGGGAWFVENEALALGHIAPDGTITQITSGLSGSPYLLATGPDGTPWFVERDAQYRPVALGHRAASGTVSEIPLALAPNRGISAVGIDGAGRPWVAIGASDGPPSLARVDGDGTLHELTDPAAAVTSGYASIARAHDGTIAAVSGYDSDGAPGRLARVNAAGTGISSQPVDVATDRTDGEVIAVGDDLWWSTARAATSCGSPTTARSPPSRCPASRSRASRPTRTGGRSGTRRTTARRPG